MEKEQEINPRTTKQKFVDNIKLLFIVLISLFVAVGLPLFIQFKLNFFGATHVTILNILELYSFFLLIAIGLFLYLSIKLL